MLNSSGRRDGVVLPSRTAPPRSGRRGAYRPTGPACQTASGKRRHARRSKTGPSPAERPQDCGPCVLILAAAIHPSRKGRRDAALPLCRAPMSCRAPASRGCRSLNGAVARVERDVRHSPGLRCFLNVRVAPWAGLAGTTAQPNVNARSGGGARCVPPANRVLLDVGQRVRCEISHGRRPQAACCERCPAPKRCDYYLTAPQQHFVRAIPLAFPGMG